MNQTIIIKGNVPSKKNSYRVAGRGGMFKPKKIGEFERMVRQEVLAQKIKRMEGELCMQCTFSTRRRNDLDNMVTSMMDALQDAGVFKNDKEIKKIVAEKIAPPRGIVSVTEVILSSYGDTE